MLDFSDHTTALFRSFCKHWVSSMLVIDLLRRVSSAKEDVIESFMHRFKSLRYMINNIGPKTVPCGTPEMTLVGIEDLLLITTDWFLLER